MKINKRIKSGFAAFVLAMSAVTSSIALPQSVNAFAGGDGSTGSPWQIATCADWMEMDDDPAKDEDHFVLTADLDCTSDGNNVMVFDSPNSFRGTLDGANHTVTIAIDTNGEDSAVGLIRNASAVAVHDLNIAGTLAAEGSENIGSLFGWIQSSLIENISSIVAITGTDVGRIGGIVGMAYESHFAQLSYGGDMMIWTSGEKIGGLIGWQMSASVADSTVSGDISYAGAIEDLGGIAGQGYYYAQIDNSSVTGGITGNTAHANSRRIGGIAGYLTGDGSRITQSSYKGDVMIAATDDTETTYVGGVVGLLESGATVDETYSMGSVSGANVTGIGGLAGAIEGEGEETLARDSYSRSEVGHSGIGTNCGGFAGLVNSEYELAMDGIQRSYATGEISCSNLYTSGFASGAPLSAWAHVSNSFWDTQTTGQSDSVFGAGKTTAEMKTESTFTDYDFDDVWAINASYNDGYPCLQWDADCYDEDGEGTTPPSLPNGGDGNADGTLDSEQDNVETVLNPLSSKYITVATNDSCTLSSVAVESDSAHISKDAGYVYNIGFVNFTATGCDDNVAHVKLYFHDIAPTGLTVRKYNPTTNAYFTITSATIIAAPSPLSGAFVSYTIIDNGDLDVNPAAGTITDPVGLGALTVGGPNTGVKRL